MDVIPQITQRQSIRSFSDRSIDRTVIERVLEAGRLAPSAKNRQPWRFIVVSDDDIRRRLQDAAFGQEHVGEARAIIAACTTNVDYRMPNGQYSYPIDLTVAVSFMMMQAESEQLGTCIVTTYDEGDVKEILTVPHLMKVVMLLLIGYPKEKPFPAQRKSLDRIVSWNHW
jgi:nitroreductase